MLSSKSHSKHITTMLAIFTIICLAAALALNGCGEKKPSADKYATGEIYTFSGYIKEAKEYEIRSHDESPGEGRTHYSIIIDTVEEMPDGTHRYENDAQNSYSTVEEYAGNPDKLVYVLISSQGYLMDCRDTPFSDEEIEHAGTVTETRNGNTTVTGKDSGNSNDNDANDNTANANTGKQRDAVNQTGMHKRSNSGEES